MEECNDNSAAARGARLSAKSRLLPHAGRRSIELLLPDEGGVRKGRERCSRSSTPRIVEVMSRREGDGISSADGPASRQVEGPGREDALPPGRTSTKRRLWNLLEETLPRREGRRLRAEWVWAENGNGTKETSRGWRLVRV